MWVYEKRLQYPVNIKNPDPKMAQFIMSQYGGPDGEIGASMRYLSQRYAMPYDACKAVLTDIGTEELAHMEIIAAIIHQLTKNLTPEQIVESGFGPYYIDHTTGIWPQAAGGVPFNACEFQSKGDVITDLTEDMAAEQKARTTYDNILRVVKDPDVCDPIRYLREREIVHFQRFGEALRITQDHLDSRNFYAFNPAFDRAGGVLPGTGNGTGGGGNPGNGMSGMNGMNGAGAGTITGNGMGTAAGAGVGTAIGTGAGSGTAAGTGTGAAGMTPDVIAPPAGSAGSGMQTGNGQTGNVQAGNMSSGNTPAGNTQMGNIQTGSVRSQNGSRAGMASAGGMQSTGQGTGVQSGMRAGTAAGMSAGNVSGGPGPVIPPGNSSANRQTVQMPGCCETGGTAGNGAVMRRGCC